MKNSIVAFFENKKVFITGHTGFKGSWLSNILIEAGANVMGYALEPDTSPNVYQLSNLNNRMNSIIGDIRDYDYLFEKFNKFQPEIVIHLAAQPLVRESYLTPSSTYEINVMGTVNLLECIRNTNCVKSFLNVTTDKVYKNKEWDWGYREFEELDGYDPYSNSKSCSELVTHCYKNSFFSDKSIAISTARAGNVIGGGDFSKDRIIPDSIKSAIDNKDIIVRNPYSTRPYQHVLEPLYAYLLIIKMQYENKENEDWYNVGPDDCDCLTTGELVNLFCEKWNSKTGNGLNWISQSDNGPHEANFLKLDCSKIKNKLNWKPNWNIKTTMDKIIEWTIYWNNNGDVENVIKKQINEFLSSLQEG